METKERNKRKTFVGVVVSRSGDKTVKVEFAFKVRHPKYKKEIRRKTVIHVHDEKNECAVGDKVEVMETRPLSRLKRFRLEKIIQKATEAALVDA